MMLNARPSLTSRQPISVMALWTVPELCNATMIDTFSLALSHGLMFLVAWRILYRPDLDQEGEDRDDREKKKSKFRRRA